MSWYESLHQKPIDCLLLHRSGTRYAYSHFVFVPVTTLQVCPLFVLSRCEVYTCCTSPDRTTSIPLLVSPCLVHDSRQNHDSTARIALSGARLQTEPRFHCSYRLVWCTTPDRTTIPLLVSPCLVHDSRQNHDSTTRIALSVVRLQTEPRFHCSYRLVWCTRPDRTTIPLLVSPCLLYDSRQNHDSTARIALSGTRDQTEPRFHCSYRLVWCTTPDRTTIPLLVSPCLVHETRQNHDSTARIALSGARVQTEPRFHYSYRLVWCTRPDRTTIPLLVSPCLVHESRQNHDSTTRIALSGARLQTEPRFHYSYRLVWCTRPDRTTIPFYRLVWCTRPDRTTIPLLVSPCLVHASRQNHDSTTRIALSGARDQTEPRFHYSYRLVWCTRPDRTTIRIALSGARVQTEPRFHYSYRLVWCTRRGKEDTANCNFCLQEKEE